MDARRRRQPASPASRAPRSPRCAAGCGRGTAAPPQRPDAYVAISDAVRERIQRHYGRDSVVVHPPVDVATSPRPARSEPGHFLWVHRLVSYKRPELVAEAFRGLPQTPDHGRRGPARGEAAAPLCRRTSSCAAGCPARELASLYEQASGFIHVGEEDFGITMVEALAAGTPVIALDRGGARDIVRAGQDGVLLSEPGSPAAIAAGVRELSATDWDADELRRSAERFSEESFRERLGAVLRAHGAS